MLVRDLIEVLKELPQSAEVKIAGQDDLGVVGNDIVDIFVHVGDVILSDDLSYTDWFEEESVL